MLCIIIFLHCALWFCLWLVYLAKFLSIVCIRYHNISCSVCLLSFAEAFCWAFGRMPILGVEMKAVEVDAQKRQHTQANFDGLPWFEAYSQLPLYDVEHEVQHCWALAAIRAATLGSLGRLSNCPVIGVGLVAHVPPGWVQLILMCSWSTSGSIQRVKMPVIARYCWHGNMPSCHWRRRRFIQTMYLC